MSILSRQKTKLKNHNGVYIACGEIRKLAQYGDIDYGMYAPAAGIVWAVETGRLSGELEARLLKWTRGKLERFIVENKDKTMNLTPKSLINALSH